MNKTLSPLRTSFFVRKNKFEETRTRSETGGHTRTNTRIERKVTERKGKDINANRSVHSCTLYQRWSESRNTLCDHPDLILPSLKAYRNENL